MGSPFPSTWGIVWPSLPAPPTCTQVCLYLVAEISDLQGIGLATVGEVQAVVTFRGEHAVLEALPGDMTGEGLLQKEEDIGENRERRPREVRAGASVGEVPSGQEMDLQEEPKGSEDRSIRGGRAPLPSRESFGASLQHGFWPQRSSTTGCWNLNAGLSWKRPRPWTGESFVSLCAQGRPDLGAGL